MVTREKCRRRIWGLFILNLGNSIRGIFSSISLASIHKHVQVHLERGVRTHTQLLIEAVGGILAPVSG